MPKSLLRPPGFLGLILAFVVASPAPVHAFLGNLKIETAYEWGHVSYGSLADFSNVDEPSLGEGLTTPEEWLFELEDEAADGFRVAFHLHPDFEIAWSHLISNTRYRISKDGVAYETDPVTSAISTAIPEVDTRLDLLSVGVRVSKWQVMGIAPLARVGFGWILTSQQGPMRFPDLPVALDEILTSLDRDYGDSDKLIEISVGAEWRWRYVNVGAELRTLHFRFDTGLDFIPAKTVHNYVPSVRVGIAF